LYCCLDDDSIFDKITNQFFCSCAHILYENEGNHVELLMVWSFWTSWTCCGRNRRNSLYDNLFEDEDSIHDSTPSSSPEIVKKSTKKKQLTETEREDLWEDFFNLTRIIEKITERIETESNDTKKKNLERVLLKREGEAICAATILGIL